MSNSSLVTCTVPNKNNYGKRNHTIDTITPHCVVGQSTSYDVGVYLSNTTYASANYIIGRDGDICLNVPEDTASWCSSNQSNDQRAVTIECASDKTHPYAMNSTVFNKLVDLCTDICKRNNKTKLLWLVDKTKTLNYTPKSNEMVITVHRWFDNKSCPGDWLYNRLQELADLVTARLVNTLYRVQVGAYKNVQYANNQKAQLIKEGYEAFIVNVDGYYKVQIGAFYVKSNAERMLQEIKAKGYSAFIQTINL